MRCWEVLSFTILFFANQIAFGNERENEGKAIRSFLYALYEEPSTPVPNLPNQFEKTKDLLTKSYRRGDVWSDKNYSFGYAKDSQGNIVMFAWKNSDESPTISFREMVDRYLDERFAAIQDNKKLELWKQARKDVAGCFINARRGESQPEFPFDPSSAALFASGNRLERLTIETYPLVVTIGAPDSVLKPKPKTLLGSAERDETN